MKTVQSNSRLRGLAKWLALCVVAGSVASCGTTEGKRTYKKHGKEYFAESEYGVKASPRVFKGKHPPKGGGRNLVGKPYKVKGKWYEPKEDKNYNKVGLASWYGSAFHGRLTANGEVYDQYHLSAAHPTFPLPSYARVTNMENGSSLIVRVNDRGPYHPGRIIDLSDKAAEMLDVQNKGTAKVRVQYVGRARMDGRDMPYLMASYTQKGERMRRFNPGGEIASGVMVASAERKFTAPREETEDMVVVPERKASATAYQESASDSPAFDSVAQPYEEYVMLPEIGPIPAERPPMYEHSLGTLAAYAEQRDVGNPAFDAILKQRENLTPALIKKVALMRNPGLF